jgi:hypothetical protein
MLMEIHVLTWDRHSNVAESIWFMESYGNKDMIKKNLIDSLPLKETIYSPKWSLTGATTLDRECHAPGLNLYVLWYSLTESDYCVD